jgi:hypothetical protein
MRRDKYGHIDTEDDSEFDRLSTDDGEEIMIGDFDRRFEEDRFDDGDDDEYDDEEDYEEADEEYIEDEGDPEDWDHYWNDTPDEDEEDEE